MRARRWGTEIVTLYVGTDEQKFIAYKDVLCNKVPYFDKMFNGGFEEANTLIARFPEDDPKPFDLMLGWVYEGTLPRLVNILIGESISQHVFFHGNWKTVELYALAEKFWFPELMDLIIDNNRDHHKKNRHFPTCERMKQGYALTSSGSLIRKYMSLCYAYVVMNDKSHPSRALSNISGLLLNTPDLNLDFFTDLERDERKRRQGSTRYARM